jgi:AcrR family transcriptional regulator
MSDTRQLLVDGAIAAIRDKGIAGASARSIAAAAGVNQALVFYHFGSVDALIQAACREAAAQQVESYRPLFRSVASLHDLLVLGQRLHAEQRSAGNVTVLAQVLAGARHNPRLAAAAREALTLWIDEIEGNLERLLVGNPLTQVADASCLARAVAAGFIGIELYEGADPDGARSAFTALEQLSALTEILDDLSPVARNALGARLRRYHPRP